MPNQNSKKTESILPKKPKVQRDANGKLIITYKSRLLEPKKLDADWRAKKLEQYEREHNDKVAGGKKSMLGYFGDARSASAGDFFVEKAKREAKEARGRGPQLRSGARHTKVVTGTFGKFVSNASGDPYLSPSQIRAAYLKEQKAKAIQAVPFAAGKKKSKMVTDTFSRPRFLSVVDGDDDVGSLKEKIKNAKATMASPSPKFERFKQPNFKTAPVKKGGCVGLGRGFAACASFSHDLQQRICDVFVFGCELPLTAFAVCHVVLDLVPVVSFCQCTATVTIL